MHVVKMLLSVQHCIVRSSHVLYCTVLHFVMLCFVVLLCPVLSILLEEDISIFSSSLISRRLSLCHIILYSLPFSFNFISFSLLHFSIKLFLFQIKNWWFFFLNFSLKMMQILFYFSFYFSLTDILNMIFFWFLSQLVFYFFDI